MFFDHVECDISSQALVPNLKWNSYVINRVIFAQSSNILKRITLFVPVLSIKLKVKSA